MAAQSFMFILFCSGTAPGASNMPHYMVSLSTHPTFTSLQVCRSSSWARSLALRTTRRSSSLSLSEEPMRKRLAPPFFWLEPLLPELVEELEDPDELPSSAINE